jgi:hypothetical protein
LDLDDGQTVEIRVDPLNIDAFLTIDFPGSRSDQVVTDDDSGIGIVGTHSAITYRAIQSGIHYVVVSDLIGDNNGGYVLSVTDSPLAANPVIIPLSYETVDTPFGLMAVFVSDNAGFSLNIPADWFEVERP